MPMALSIQISKFKFHQYLLRAVLPNLTHAKVTHYNIMVLNSHEIYSISTLQHHDISTMKIWLYTIQTITYHSWNQIGHGTQPVQLLRPIQCHTHCPSLLQHRLQSLPRTGRVPHYSSEWSWLWFPLRNYNQRWYFREVEWGCLHCPLNNINYSK